MIKVDKFLDKDGNLREGKYGNQLILSFAVYRPGKEEEPTEIMMFKDDSLGIESEVVIPKFVYYTYRDTKTGEMNTAITPNSAITKTFKALGWTFDATKALNTEDFIDSWVEVNVDDFESKDKDGNEFTASTIAGINPYKGPAPKVGNKSPSKEEPMEVEVLDVLEEDDLPSDIQTRIDELKEQVVKGNLSKEGFETAKRKLIASVEK